MITRFCININIFNVNLMITTKTFPQQLWCGFSNSDNFKDIKTWEVDLQVQFWNMHHDHHKTYLYIKLPGIILTAQSASEHVCHSKKMVIYSAQIQNYSLPARTEQKRRQNIILFVTLVFFLIKISNPVECVAGWYHPGCFLLETF